MEILNEKQQLERELEVIKARQSQIAEEERQAAENKRNEQLIVHANLVQQAQSLRTEAGQIADERTKLLLYGQAADITTEANRLAVELGLIKADELEEKPRFSIPKKAKPFIQIGGLLSDVVGGIFGQPHFHQAALPRTICSTCAMTSSMSSNTPASS